MSNTLKTVVVIVVVVVIVTVVVVAVVVVAVVLVVSVHFSYWAGQSILDSSSPSYVPFW